MKLKIKGKILVMVVSIMALLSISMLIDTFYQVGRVVNKDYDKQLNSNGSLMENLIDEKYRGDWRIDGDNLFKGEKLLNGDTEFVDLIKEKTGCEATIFLGTVRISTTVLKDGIRAVGTKASETVTQKVIKDGGIYRGKADIINKPYEVRYTPIKDSSGAVIGMLFIGAEKSEVNKEINTLIWIIASINIIALILAYIIASIVTKGVTKPLASAVSHLGQVADGDLTREVSDAFLRRSDEIGELSTAISNMQTSMKAMIENVKGSAKNIGIRSENISEVAENMSSSSHNVATAIHDIAKGAENQSQDLMHINQILNDFGNSLDNMVQAIKAVDESSKGINHMAVENNEIMKELITSVEKMGKLFNGLKNNINDLGHNIDKIHEIITFINGISDQTNLLALNASIEAARAGETGKGFAVVAEEIRKLAEQSKISSADITAILGGISSETDVIVDSSENMQKELNLQTKTINESIASFRRIIGGIQEIIPQIEIVSEDALKINGEKNTIIDKVRNSSEIASETSEYVEEISASSEQMNLHSGEVAATAQTFNDMTKEMIESVERFKI